MAEWSAIVGLALCGAFGIGFVLGQRAMGMQWRERAKGDPRMCSSGRLYHVIADGDREKLARVQQWQDDAELRARARGAGG